VNCTGDFVFSSCASLSVSSQRGERFVSVRETGYILHRFAVSAGAGLSGLRLPVGGSGEVARGGVALERVRLELLCCIRPQPQILGDLFSH
jgi:hypothetical protein